jgi:hypothetical protein
MGLPERISAEGYGLQPVHKATQISGALAPEGIRQLDGKMGDCSVRLPLEPWVKLSRKVLDLTMGDTNQAKILAELLDHVLLRLVGLARDQKEAQRLLLQARAQIDAILQASPRAGKYSRHSKVTMAARQYLEEDARHPVPAEQIVEGLIDAGFQRGDDTPGNIRRAISKFTDNGEPATATRALRVKDGRVGLGEWPDERWD